jgi:hypothetical protein
VLLSPHEAEIKVHDVIQRYGFAAIGLADGRNSERPRAEWRMLVTYAENPEPDAYYKLPDRDGLKVDISKFRRWLQGFFGIPGDPLKPFSRRAGYRVLRFEQTISGNTTSYGGGIR